MTASYHGTVTITGHYESDMIGPATQSIGLVTTSHAQLASGVRFPICLADPPAADRWTSSSSPAARHSCSPGDSPRTCACPGNGPASPGRLTPARSAADSRTSARHAMPCPAPDDLAMVNDLSADLSTLRAACASPSYTLRRFWPSAGRGQVLRGDTSDGMAWAARQELDRCETDGGYERCAARQAVAPPWGHTARGGGFSCRRGRFQSGGYRSGICLR